MPKLCADGLGVMLDETRRAEAWKRRATEAERQRDQAEEMISEMRDALVELVADLERFMFAAAKSDHPAGK